MAVIRGTNGVDTLRGTSYADTIYGYAGNDLLFGYAGNDILIGGTGADYLSGGTGIDTASYQYATAAVQVGLTGDPLLAAGEALGDRFVSIENLTGSGFGDVLAGNAYANVLRGLGGSDNLLGGSGNDTLDGGSGHDYLHADAGNDSVNGGTGRDWLSFQFEKLGVRLLLSATGCGTSTVGTSHDTVVSVENLDGSVYRDYLRPASGGTVYGNAGNDVIYDALGTATREVLDGGLGNDILDGRSGNGSDLFALHSGWGIDTIRGFDARAAGDDDLFYVAGYEFGITAPVSVVNHASNDATIAGPQFIFNTATRYLLFDSDGTGAAAASVIAYLDTSCVLVGGGLSAADFFVY